MKEKLRERKSVFDLLLYPLILFILTECYTHNPFAHMGAGAWLANLIFYWGLAWLFYGLTGKLKIALWLETVLVLCAGLANYYVIAFRDSPVLPWDIFSMGTAASVADNFSYALPIKVWLVLGGYALLALTELLLPVPISEAGKEAKLFDNKSAVNGRLPVILTALLVLSIWGILLQQKPIVNMLNLNDDITEPDKVQTENGLLAAFIGELKYLRVEKPTGYDREACEAQLEDYNQNGREQALQMQTQEPAAYPNIIVVMNEAFSDMSYLGNFACNKEYIPYFNSLLGSENTVSGKLHVSVLGGNTANTEFEFLTGNTMAFLPYGSIPYQQFIKGEIPSLASVLKEKGYDTVAMHPYFDTGWSRDRIYPWMGFEKAYFIDSYENPEYIRKYVSDRSDYDALIWAYENRNKDKPFFLFNVTMQNHGGYDQRFDNFTPEVEATDIKSQPLSNYLSLISVSDEQLSRLIAYFEQVEEDTLVLFFGDHQPNDTVADPIWQYLGVDSDNLTAKQECVRYSVPFLLWANYDIAEKSGIETSANYLALELLEQAGIPRQGYYGYLEELRKAYPIISAKQVRDANGKMLTKEEQSSSEELEKYREMQYYRMFDQ